MTGISQPPPLGGGPAASDGRAWSMIKLFFEGLNMGVLVTERATNVVVWCSKVAESQLGYSAGEMLGRDSSLLYAEPGAHEAMLRRAHQALAEVGVFRSEISMRRKDGSTFDCELSINVMVDPTRLQLAIRDISERKEAERQIAHSRDELRRLSARLETLREEERTRVVRRLQEGLGQDLAALTLGLSFLRDCVSAEHREMADRLVDTMRSTLDHVKEVCAGLRPAILDHLGLVATLEWLAGDFEKSSGIRCRVDVDGADAFERVQDPYAIAFLRIVEESLSNVRRHSGARSVRIHAAGESGGQLALTITDDGRGVSPENLESPASLGLLGIRERALVLGGRAEIRRGPDGGTVVEVRIPHASATA